MKTIKRITILVLISSVLTTFSCTKEGKQGETGPAGANGINGTNGTDGNANVKSYTINVASGNWTLSGNTYYFDASISGITSDIINSGSVQIFMESTTSTGVWLTMPWIEYINSSTFSTYNFNHSLGGVRIFKTDSDITPPSNPGVRKFKVIVISSSARISNPNIDYNNYYEVKGAFNLKD
jgi:hypothetical protein